MKNDKTLLIGALSLGAFYWLIMRPKNTGDMFVKATQAQINVPVTDNLPVQEQATVGSGSNAPTTEGINVTQGTPYAQYTQRGIRNNNPLNIRKTSDQWNGMIGADKDAKGNRFVIFSSPEYGIRAAYRIMKNYAKRGLVTPRDVITTWAPPSENNTIAYLSGVTKLSGLSPTTILTTDALYMALIKSMIYMENGVQPYPDDLILAGMRMT